MIVQKNPNFIPNCLNVELEANDHCFWNRTGILVTLLELARFPSFISAVEKEALLTTSDPDMKKDLCPSSSSPWTCSSQERKQRKFWASPEKFQGLWQVVGKGLWEIQAARS